MARTVVNRPKISKWIAGGYFFLLVLMSFIFLIILIASIRTSPFNLQIFFFGLMSFVLLLLVLILCSLRKTKYVIRNGILHSWSPFAIINLKLRDIKKIERTRVPFHIRVGASLYCGWFFVPGLGWTKSIITNLTDGLLITSKGNKYYLITPSNPDKFMKLLKK